MRRELHRRQGRRTSGEQILECELEGLELLERLEREQLEEGELRA